MNTSADNAVVSIYPGDDIQAIVNAHPAGTMFVVKAGIHTNQTLPSRDGDVFIGEEGSILHGTELLPRNEK